MSRDSVLAPPSPVGEQRPHATRRGLLSIPPLVALASILAARPAASAGTVECVADLGAF
jgi:hypothetical protein